MLTANKIVERYFFLIVLAIASFSVLPFLSLAEIFQPSEAREGTVIYEILSAWEFILPLRNGEIVPSKPILFHWIGAFFALLFDLEINEFAARLPSAISGIFCVLVVALSARAIAGTLAAYLSALVLCSTYGFMHLAQDSRVDMVYCFFSTASFLFWFLSYLKKTETWKVHFVSSLIAGFAVLAKGPVGFVMPVLGIGLVSIFNEGFKAGLKRANPIWVLSFVISLPWYLAAAKTQGFVSRQIMFENILRFIGGEGIRRKPFWFYLTYIWTQAAPWIEILAIAFLILLFVKRRPREAFCTFLPKDELARKAAISSFVYVVGMFVFFSVASGKRRAYLLPLLPIFSLFLGICLSRLDLSFLISRSSKRTYYLLFSSLAFLFPALVFSSFAFNGLPQKAQATLSVVPEVFFRAWVRLCFLYFFYLLLSFIFFGRAFSKNLPIFSFLSFYLLFQLALSVYKPFGLAVKAKTHSVKEIVPEVAALLPDGNKLNIVKARLDESFDCFVFYYKKYVVFHDPKNFFLKPGYYLVHLDWFEEYRSRDPRNFRIIYQKGRLVEKPEEKLIFFKVS